MFDFDSGHGLTVCEFVPPIGLSTVSTEPASDPLSPSLLAPPQLSLSKIINKHFFLKRMETSHGGSRTGRQNTDTFRDNVGAGGREKMEGFLRLRGSVFFLKQKATSSARRRLHSGLRRAQHV